MEKFGICKLSIIPVRAEGNDRAEQVTQLLFGEIYKIIEISEKWLKIKNQFDQYEGWIDRIQHSEVSVEYYNKHSLTEHKSLTKYSTIVSEGNIFYPILLGSTLPFYDNEFIKIEKEVLNVDGALPILDSIVDSAFLYYNAPYLWGGKTPYGIDCSGFTQQVFKLHGVKLLRDASQQITQGNEVELTSVREGDLAFFEKNEKITHVGIILGGNQIIHAHGKVRIDKLDDKGIFNTERKEYSHKIHSVRRYF